MVLFHALKALCLFILTEIGVNLLKEQAKDVLQTEKQSNSLIEASLRNWLQLMYDQQFDIEIHYLFV